jgi:hypothetical protein
MKKTMAMRLRTRLGLHQIGAVLPKLALLLVAVLLVFSSGLVACTQQNGEEEEEENGSPAETTIPDEFILVGTAPSISKDQGNILLYKFTSGMAPFASPTEPMVVASFPGGTVQGLDILDYENDSDLDFVAVVRYETNTPDVWRYVLYFYENANINNTQFAVSSIEDLPEISGAWNAALTDCTAGDFDVPSDNRVDVIVMIGDATPSVIYKFKNTGNLGTPFARQPYDVTDTQGWATHARRMDSANFNPTQDQRGDFATFDYPAGVAFQDDVVVCYNNAPFVFSTTYFITHNTTSIHTITAGTFCNSTAPDVIVGGDDDGDPGHYWLYCNRGDGYFSGSFVDAFDLNPAAGPGSPQSPGGGVADAYDFNAAGKMDVVATAGDMNGMTALKGSHTIWYIESSGSATFAAPFEIDIITTAAYGNVWSIAAPMTTRFGVG